MGELGSDFSLGGERAIKREEEKETSTNLCPWFGQPAGSDSTSAHSPPAWITCVVFFGAFGWHILRWKGFPPLGKLQECVLEQSEARRREDSSNFPFILASTGISSVEEWGQELWPSVWVEATKPGLAQTLPIQPVIKGQRMQNRTVLLSPLTPLCTRVAF